MGTLSSSARGQPSPEVMALNTWPTSPPFSKQFTIEFNSYDIDDEPFNVKDIEFLIRDLPQEMKGSRSDASTQQMACAVSEGQ
jgi:hypothetical protein